MGGGNERRPAPPLVRRAPAPVARPKRKEARTIEVDCTELAAMMQVDPAKPVPIDLDADIEVVASDPRIATPTRSGRLAHTKPRFASGSGALDPMPAPAVADGVPEPLEDMPTAASDRTAAPGARVAPAAPEPPAMIAEPAVSIDAAPVRRVTAARIAFVLLVVAAWCAAVLAV